MNQPERTDDRWLAWLREMHSVARAGLAYGTSPHDLDRYLRLEELSIQMLAALADAPPERLRLLLDDGPGYVTAKLDVRAAVHDDAGRLLLVRETQDGRWSLPGGWADVNESIAEGAVREVAEESGYRVVVDRLLGVYDRERWGHPPMPAFTLKAVLACRPAGGTPRASAETDAVDWFARDALPPLSTGRTSARLLERVFEHHDRPSLPPDLS